MREKLEISVVNINEKISVTISPNKLIMRNTRSEVHKKGLPQLEGFNENRTDIIISIIEVVNPHLAFLAEKIAQDIVN